MTVRFLEPPPTPLQVALGHIGDDLRHLRDEPEPTLAVYVDIALRALRREAERLAFAEAVQTLRRAA